MPQVVDQLRPEFMRSGIAREFRAKRIESGPAGGLRQVLDAPPRDQRGTFTLPDEPLDPGSGLAELSVKDPGAGRDETQDAGGLGHSGDDQPAAFALGNEFAGPFPAPHRAVFVVSRLEKAVIFLPFAEILLPSRRERSDLAPDEAADAALSVHPFLEPVGRHTAQLPKAGAIGDKRPDRRRRLGETHFPMETVDSAATCFHAALPPRRRLSARPTGRTNVGQTFRPVAKGEREPAAALDRRALGWTRRRDARSDEAI